MPKHALSIKIVSRGSIHQRHSQSQLESQSESESDPEWVWWAGREGDEGEGVGVTTSVPWRFLRLLVNHSHVGQQCPLPHHGGKSDACQP